MSLRMILYGYEIKNGEPVVLEAEAKIVRDIYANYISGKSLNGIADELTKEGVIYYLDKSVWTKNLIARIIANPKYAGADGYPAIILQADFELANKRKLDMGGTQAELPPITALIKSKLVCSCCGQNIGRRNNWRSREKWSCPNGCKVDIYLGDSEIFSALLNVLRRVQNNPQLLRLNTDPIGYSPSIEVIRQNKEIERAKEQTSVEFRILCKMVLKCVEHKYECCPLDRSQAMTEVLIDKYRKLPPIKELDITLIRETVQRIAINRDGSLTVTFINCAEVSSRETEGNCRG